LLIASLLLPVPVYGVEQIPGLPSYEDAETGVPIAISARYGEVEGFQKFLTHALIKAVREDKLDRVKQLLELGADPNGAIFGGYCTPRSVSYWLELPEIEQWLVSKGAESVSSKYPPWHLDTLLRDLEAEYRRELSSIESAKTNQEIRSAEIEKRQAGERVEDQGIAKEAEKRIAEEVVQRIARDRESAEQKALWTQFIKLASGKQTKPADAAFDKLGPEIVNEKESQSTYDLSGNIPAQKGKAVFLFATFHSNASSGILMTIGRYGDRLIYVTGVKPGALVSGEDLALVGRVQGTYTYQTVRGGSNTVPHVQLLWRR
jgi:hypothetical protein